jgi:hypothetical protein
LVKIVDKMKKYLATQVKMHCCVYKWYSCIFFEQILRDIYIGFLQIGHPVASYMIPNSGKIIASGDIQEINRLLQFILGCAVNSQRKDHFVKEILKMEETVQVSKIRT